MFNNILKFLSNCFHYLYHIIKDNKVDKKLNDNLIKNCKINNNIINMKNMDKNEITEQKNKKSINKFTFILFAEFVGYESPFIEWVENMCKGEKLEDFQLKLIERDSDYILKEMLKEFDEDSIKEWFFEFYDIILKDYDETLKKITTLTKI